MDRVWVERKVATPEGLLFVFALFLFPSLCLMLLYLGDLVLELLPGSCTRHTDSP